MMHDVALSGSSLRESPASPDAVTVAMRDELRRCVPFLVVGARVPISPLERFAIAQVDGARNIEQLAEGIVLTVSELRAIFVDLSRRGAVRLEAPPAQERRSHSMMRTKSVRDDDEIALEDADLVVVAESVPPPPPSSARGSSAGILGVQSRPALPTIPPVSAPRPMPRR